MDPKKRPATKTMEPPAPKKSEQVPAGDDSDINEGRDQRDPEDIRSGRPARKRTENKPIEKDSDKGENTGCAC